MDRNNDDDDEDGNRRSVIDKNILDHIIMSIEREYHVICSKLYNFYGGWNRYPRSWWQTQIGSINGIWLDSNGVLYFADTGNYVVRKVDVYGTNAVVNIFAGTLAISGDSGDYGPATTALFLNPFGICGLTNGVIYITDPSSSRIRSVIGGIISSVTGIPSTPLCIDGLPGIAGLSKPYLCRPDNNDNILIADGDCNSIRLLNTQTNSLTTIIGSGTAGLVLDAWTNAQLNSPLGVFCCDAAGSIYIADSANNGIRVQPPQPTDSTYVVAGSSGGVSGSATNTIGVLATF